MIKTVSELIAEAKSQCSCLDVTTALEMFNDTDGAVIIDVREPGEAEKKKLEQSSNIPRGLLEMKIIDLCPEADTTIILHCGAGGRASLSALTLQNMGYNNVHVIDAEFDDILKIFS